MQCLYESGLYLRKYDNIPVGLQGGGLTGRGGGGGGRGGRGREEGGADVHPPPPQSYLS